MATQKKRSFKTRCITNRVFPWTLSVGTTHLSISPKYGRCNAAKHFNLAYLRLCFFFLPKAKITNCAWSERTIERVSNRFVVYFVYVRELYTNRMQSIIIQANIHLHLNCCKYCIGRKTWARERERCDANVDSLSEIKTEKWKTTKEWNSLDSEV